MWSHVWEVYHLKGSPARLAAFTAYLMASTQFKCMVNYFKNLKEQLDWMTASITWQQLFKTCSGSQEIRAANSAKCFWSGEVVDAIADSTSGPTSLICKASPSASACDSLQNVPGFLSSWSSETGSDYCREEKGERGNRDVLGVFKVQLQNTVVACTCNLPMPAFQPAQKTSRRDLQARSYFFIQFCAAVGWWLNYEL